VFSRTKYKWNVTLSSLESPETFNYEVDTYWSPTFDTSDMTNGSTPEQKVGRAAAVEAWHKSGKVKNFQAVKAELVS
jgi:hypothetical protein